MTTTEEGKGKLAERDSIPEFENHTEVICESCGGETIHLADDINLGDIALVEGQKNPAILVRVYRQFCVNCRRFVSYTSQAGLAKVTDGLKQEINEQINGLIEGAMIVGEEGTATPADLTTYINSLLQADAMLDDEEQEVISVNIGPARAKLLGALETFERFTLDVQKRQQQALERVQNRGERRLERLKLEMQSKIDRLTVANQELKAGMLQKEEQKRYATLQTWTADENPLKIILHLLNAKQMSDESWRVPSSEGNGYYEIPADLSTCECPRFRHSRSCSHLRALALRTRVEWGNSSVQVQVEDMSAYMAD